MNIETKNSKVKHPSHDLIESKRNSYQVYAKYGKRYVVSKFERGRTLSNGKMHYITKAFYDACNKIRKSGKYDINLFFAGCFIEDEKMKSRLRKSLLTNGKTYEKDSDIVNCSDSN